jgi:hypothetical protein
MSDLQSNTNQPSSFNEKMLVAQFVQQTGARFAGELDGAMLFNLAGAIFTEKEILQARERFVKYGKEKLVATEIVR